LAHLSLSVLAIAMVALVKACGILRNKHDPPVEREELE
jgi:hypothetical protein